MIESNELFCQVCGAALQGRQRKFCSRSCKNLDTNHRHQNYVSQQARGLSRKLTLVRERGSCCEICGYSKNVAALVWHHRDPTTKAFVLDVRAMSNRSLEVIQQEAEKCQLLCANCHAEVHYPHCSMP